jgi:hypothetical protein
MPSLDAALIPAGAVRAVPYQAAYSLGCDSGLGHSNGTWLTASFQDVPRLANLGVALGNHAAFAQRGKTAPYAAGVGMQDHAQQAAFQPAALSWTGNDSGH